MGLKVADLIAQLTVDAKGVDREVKAETEKARRSLSDGFQRGAREAGEALEREMREAATEAGRAGERIGGDLRSGIEEQVNRGDVVDVDRLVDRSEFGAAGDAAGKALADGVEAGAGTASAKIDPEQVVGSPAEFGAAGERAGGAVGEGLGAGVLDGIPDLSAGVGGLLDDMLGSLPAGVAGPATAAGAAIGAAFVAGMSDAIANEAGNDLIGERLSDLGGSAGEVGRVQSNLFRQAWGESADDVRASIDEVYSTIAEGRGSEADLERLTRKAMAVAQVVDSDVRSVVSNVGVLMHTGLARDADEAFDLITASAKRVPAAVRDEVTEATHEYSQYFAGLGFSGEQAMGMLVKASEGGRYAIDKTGDSIKEFRIKATDMSDATAKGYEQIGLSQVKYTDLLLQGGQVAQRAYQEIMEAILAIEDPTARSTAALALFGTPLEDISGDAARMDEVLGALAHGSLPDVAGAADDAVDSFVNMESAFTTVKRTIMGGFEDLANQKLDPFADAIKDSEGGGEKWATAVGKSVGGQLVDSIKLQVFGIGGLLLNPIKDVIPGMGDTGEDAGKAWHEGFIEGAEKDGPIDLDDLTPEQKDEAADEAPGFLSGRWTATGAGRTDWENFAGGIDKYRRSASEATEATTTFGHEVEQLEDRVKPIGTTLDQAAVGAESFRKSLGTNPFADMLSSALNVDEALNGIADTIGDLDSSEDISDIADGLKNPAEDTVGVLQDMLNLAGPLQERIASVFEFSGAEAAVAAADDIRERLVRIFTQAGLSKEQITELLEVMNLTAQDVEVAIKVSGQDVAIAQLQILRDMVEGHFGPDGDYKRLDAFIGMKIAEGDFTTARDLVAAFQQDMADGSLDNPILLALNADPNMANEVLDTFALHAADAVNITNLAADATAAWEELGLWTRDAEGRLTNTNLGVDTLIADSQFQAWKKQLESQGVKIPVNLEVAVHGAQGIIDAGGSGVPYRIDVLEYAQGRDLNGNGIVGRAIGGDVWPGRWLVGEHGPEILEIPTMGTVIPAGPTQSIMGAYLPEQTVASAGRMNDGGYAGPSGDSGAAVAMLAASVEALAREVARRSDRPINVTAPTPERAAALVARELRADDWGVTP